MVFDAVMMMHTGFPSRSECAADARCSGRNFIAMYLRKSLIERAFVRVAGTIYRLRTTFGFNVHGLSAMGPCPLWGFKPYEGFFTSRDHDFVKFDVSRLTV